MKKDFCIDRVWKYYPPPPDQGPEDFENATGNNVAAGKVEYTKKYNIMLCFPRLLLMTIYGYLCCLDLVAQGDSGAVKPTLQKRKMNGCSATESATNPDSCYPAPPLGLYPCLVKDRLFLCPLIRYYYM